MLILKIKQPGLLINLPGLGSRRTPVEIDITKLNMNNVLGELRSQGINDFEIKNKTENKSTNEKNVKPKKSSTLENQISDSFINILKEKLENIEDLLLEINENLNVNNIQLESKNKSQEPEKIINKESEIEDEDEEFIPNIDLNGLKLNK